MDTKTAELILEHIQVVDITSIVISYLEPDDKEDTKLYAVTGFYEKCMGIGNANEGLCMACQTGHMDIVRYMIEKGATKCNECSKPLDQH